MLELLIDLRAYIRDRIPTQPGRAEYLAKILADDGIWKMLSDGDRSSAYVKAISEVPQ